MGRWLRTYSGRCAHWVDDTTGESVCARTPLRTQPWTAEEIHSVSRCSYCVAITSGHTGSRDVIASVGVTYRQLDFWTRRGWVVASPRPPGATSGTPRSWPEGELRVAAVMARLVAAGLAPHAAHRAARGGGILAPGGRVSVEEPALSEAS